ncbi:MAG: PilN domain-containing protein [Turicibacter sp.]|nr:PilN domain-containing protein [Turicibacter sp.]
MKRDINFFSTYQLKNQDKHSQNLYGYLLGSAVGLFIFGTFGVNQYQLMKVNRQISDLEEKLADPIIQEQIEESDRAYKIAELLEQYDSGLKSLLINIESRDLITTQKLDLISSTIPSEVQFGSLSITNTTITISATSTSRTAIAEVQHNLKQLDFIADVYIGSIGGTESYSFSLNCTLKDVN